jgi:putative ABC transport system permease protein
MLESTVQDIKFAARTFRRYPGTSLAIVISLALSIGANSTLFSIVDTVLLERLPFEEPDRLVMIWNRYGTDRTASSPPDFMDRKKQSEVLESVAAMTPISKNLAGPGAPQEVQAAGVTSDFFAVLGRQPLIGRLVLPREDGAEPADTCVLSYGLWHRAFGGERDVIGRLIELNGAPMTVIAVMPADFDIPRGSDLWLPLVFTPRELADDYRGNEYLQVLGRLKAGATLEQVQAEMSSIAKHVIDTVPERRGFLVRNGWGAQVVPLEDELLGDVRTALLVLLGAVVLLLLMACANVANILVARSTHRAREIAVRFSLGAGRGRLACQLLVESLLLALAGGGLGLMMCLVLIQRLPSWVPHDVPRLEQVSLDLRLFAFTAAVSLLAGLFFGLAPMGHLSKNRLYPMGREVGSGGRLRKLLVTNEVALAFVLMIGAGLLFRSFERLTALDPGFERNERISFRLTVPASMYPEAHQRRALQDAILARLRTLPGVRSAAVSSRVPLGGSPWSGTFHVEGFEPVPGDKTPGADFNVVSPRYLDTLGIPLLMGRDFSETDRIDSRRVVLVDEWTAKRFWPGQSPIGKRIYRDKDDLDYREIVGVVGHVIYDRLDEEGRMQVYFPSTQGALTRPYFTLRTALGPPLAMDRIRSEVSRLDPKLPLYAVRTMDEILSQSVALPRFNAWVLGSFSLLALVLSATGLYGVLAFSVSCRTAEIGMRMALGATRQSILTWIVREALRVITAGLLLGSIGALALTRTLAGLLYGVEPADPPTYAVISILFLTVALLAALVPSVRAARLNPVDSLRSE